MCKQVLQNGNGLICMKNNNSNIYREKKVTPIIMNGMCLLRPFTIVDASPI